MVTGQHCHFRSGHAKPVHAALDMDRRIGWIIRFTCNIGPISSLADGVDHGFQLCAQQRRFIARSWAIQHIDSGVRTDRISKDFTFASRGNEVDTTASTVKRAANSFGAQSISVGLDGRSDLGARSQVYEGFVICLDLSKVDAQGRAG